MVTICELKVTATEDAVAQEVAEVVLVPVAVVVAGLEVTVPVGLPGLGVWFAGKTVLVAET